ncbi:hypothetical protein C1645_828899 [Glomus cerebriforme]|uniref:Uncharacterized protein n=1 Tax=Glomus cerebriforme TaxID=658196 RepID=A0A397SPY8_9GLOM|nr:hypothetical protein C1645_828899 [Glomus cerebriforme]
MNYKTELEKLHIENKSLFYKIQIFVNDLLTFNDSKNARNRLEKDPMAKFFFSNVYFSKEEIEYLFNFPTSSGLSVSKFLDVTLLDKINSHQLCSSHDLAPLIQQVFDIQKNFQKEKYFKKNLKIFEKNWNQNYNEL